ncbi:hypothetical protein ACFQ4N_10085 [Oceanobacillus iheyensis]|uniref:Uncharacterized protein n=1 Tax=Oceanobacillus iheyensis (strain DSM 14371 / CIP 107618 / JCM 11309 / KCTC 3954 / HTE831) TaxID=221109 RepID=Q8ERG3_OCEIH|nr:hypothetical protein [Oceanobacillus iheyensis]BAC13295.1 hypothetical protein [Oceanobacillus iheyensis HTE831]
MSEHKKVELQKGFYIYGVVLFLYWGLMFFLEKDYFSSKYMIEGMSFIGAAVIIYFLLVYLFNKSDVGKKVVMWSLSALFLVAVIGFFVTIS